MIPAFGINWPPGIMGKCKSKPPNDICLAIRNPRTSAATYRKIADARGGGGGGLFLFQITHAVEMGRMAKSDRMHPTRSRAESREMGPSVAHCHGSGWRGAGDLAALSIEFAMAGARNQPFLNKLPPIWQAAALLFRRPNSGELDTLDRAFGDAVRLIARGEKAHPHTRWCSGAGDVTQRYVAKSPNFLNL